MSSKKTVTPYLVAVAAIVTLGGGLALAPSFAGEPRTPPAAAGWLSIPQVHDRLEAAGYRNIEKIERERGGYEVRATDRNGARIKLHLDAQSGAVLDRRFRDGHEDEAREDSRRRSRDGVDCSKRRCRDDLPPATATSPAAGPAPAPVSSPATK
ncbi:MAG TPA: PepSY domain-containing protein [Azospira sp.]|nr:PepSY domain-containing protein [Azospira sp.]